MKNRKAYKPLYVALSFVSVILVLLMILVTERLIALGSSAFGFAFIVEVHLIQTMRTKPVVIHKAALLLTSISLAAILLCIVIEIPYIAIIAFVAMIISTALLLFEK